MQDHAHGLVDFDNRVLKVQSVRIRIEEAIEQAFFALYRPQAAWWVQPKYPRMIWGEKGVEISEVSVECNDHSIQPERESSNFTVADSVSMESME